MSKLQLFLSFVCFAFISAILQAKVLGPREVVQKAADGLFTITKEQRCFQRTPEKLRDVIKNDLMPYVDHTYSAYKVLGSALKGTTAAQRKKFVTAFENYITLIYADLLAQYENQTYYIERTVLSKNQDTARVYLRLDSKSHKSIQLEFLLRKSKKTQTWLIYDMITENISLLSAKQTEFSKILRDRGIDDLIKQLKNESKPKKNNLETKKK